MTVRRRRICWPNPDKVCLEGGCLYCEDGPLTSLDNIRSYASSHGLMKAFMYGLRNLEHRIQ
jgi:hypothetical protein